MKKFVAVVLALVMVLGLSTVAFADTKNYEGKDVTIVAKDGSKVEVDKEAKVVMTLESKSTKDGKFASLTPASFDVDDGTVYTVVDEAIADFLLTVGGTKYFAVKMDAPTVEVDGATLYTAPKKALCDKVGENEDVYVVIKGVYYPIDGADYAVLTNGKVVTYNSATAVDPTAHVEKAESLKYATDGSVASFVCDICGKTVNVIPAAKKPAFATNYVEIVLSTNDTYAYVVGSAVATTDGDKVKSAETFDAGIAMYVGMSVMAAAGSAVVLKKKD